MGNGNGNSNENENGNGNENLSREELKQRLREKIKSKSTSRTNGISRKKGENMSTCFKKITEILMNKNIQEPEQIDDTLIDTIMSVINKEDLQLLINKMNENSKFKDLLNTITSKMTA